MNGNAGQGRRRNHEEVLTSALHMYQKPFQCLSRNSRWIHVSINRNILTELYIVDFCYAEFEDESLVGHFPMVVPEPKTAAVGTAMTVQAPKPEFKVNRTHYHMPNQLMEDPEGK
mmetsp:Transcript_11023/g.13344  ORF Transcript_11023/g.13344 Transcript_11023/m.13344 type:complete len:115 (-) Transcript_11023:688-1032(-)